MSIATIRSALAEALDGISGLRAVGYVTDQVNPPMATVNLKRIDYDLVFADGPATYTFAVMVYAGRTEETAAQTLLDTYCEPTGSGSVKATIETAEVVAAMGVAADYVNVKTVNGVGVAPVGEAEYLAVEFEVEVVA